MPIHAEIKKRNGAREISEEKSARAATSAFVRRESKSVLNIQNGTMNKGVLKEFALTISSVCFLDYPIFLAPFQKDTADLKSPFRKARKALSK